jgi:hypothetical protein
MWIAATLWPDHLHSDMTAVPLRVPLFISPVVSVPLWLGCRAGDRGFVSER